MTKPAAGEVFRYPFLWKREQMAGETEGRKTRPVCIAVTVAKSDNETVVFILPITTQPLLPSRRFIEVPQIESQRVGLETHVRKWVMLDEINTESTQIFWSGPMSGRTARPSARSAPRENGSAKVCHGSGGIVLLGAE